MSRRSVCLGTDFDNTVVRYDHLFRQSIEAMGVAIPNEVVDKTALRDLTRAQPNGELLWQRAQADVYGRRVCDAEMIEGFKAVVEACRERSVHVYVVSHKTQFAEQDRTLDLRVAAEGWMADHGFFDPQSLGFRREDIFFESTRTEKVLKIAEIGCTHFVDDMPEVLTDPDFPAQVKGIWFSETGTTSDLNHARSWPEVQDHVFDAVE
jgi:hypothetical protein